MNWVKNNVSVLLFLGLLLLFIGTGVSKLVQENDLQEIKVVSGDTLWSLAEEHSGNMAPRAWIHQVRENNAITDDTIVAGKTLVIPANVKDLNKMEIASDQ
ncbi:MAG: LysM peptidoglycan-binding domain-containing protein [Kurthia sp.]|nr:LysM peptidoglycan-binding domain-containing protein [Candidatus Kurthia equi]